MNQTLILEFDGGSRGNPGPGGIGVVLRAQDGTPLYTLGRCIGRATNNVAEYRALITGLEKARELGAESILVRGDSQLIVNQMIGTYRVKHPDMKLLHEEASDLVRQFKQAKFEHNLRHKNKLADKLLNLALDRKRDVTEEESEGESSSPLDEPPPAVSAPGDRFACARCGCVISILRPSSLRPHQLKPFQCQCGAKLQPAPQAGASSQQTASIGVRAGEM